MTVGLPMLGLNKPQLSWYKKHGGNDHFAGICYWDLNQGDKSQISFAEFLNQEKSGSIRLPDAPLYVITWGESLVTQPYSGSYQTQEESQVSITDENGNTSSGTVTGPVTHSYSGTKHYYVAQGILQRWDVKTQKLIPVLPLHNHNRTVFTSASTSLLKDGLEAVKQAEERQAPRLRPAVLPSSEKPAAQPSSGSASPETDGTASITSTPDGAEIFVDS
ncbi:MAG: hypothetical protein JO159_20170, partial [Acidobacteria bacterium]|nr:hypothetical protein [Acidobacteriota bacterium]